MPYNKQMWFKTRLTKTAPRLRHGSTPNCHRLEQAGFMIMQLWGIHEFMILNTCNRVEVITVVSEETAKNGILRHIMGFTHFKEDKYYLKTDRAAFEHLCLVTGGMLSQTPGENHITAQMKEALEQSKTRGW